MLTQVLKSTVLVAALPFALGCAAEGDALEPASDLEDTLRAPRMFSVDPESIIHAVAVALRQDSESAVDFEIVTGEIELMARDGALGITHIHVELADVTIPATVLPPNGLVLTDMSIDLGSAASAEAEWTTDGRRVDATIDVDLTVEWAMLRDGESYPLADVRVIDLPIAVAVTRDGDRLDLSLAADRSGPFWSWAETFELRDLQLELAGAR